MERFDIITTIGAKYHIGNIENGEFSYAKALKTVGKDIRDYQKATEGTKHQNLDLRFENERLAILIETKNRFSQWHQNEIYAQLQAYVRLEKEYSDKRIVAILAETDGDDIRVWHGQSVIIDDEHLDENERSLRPFHEYEDMCFGKINDKLAVVDSINALNKMLHADGINEHLRSQFVGTCLLALKNGLSYKDAKETLGKDGQTLTKTGVVLRNITDILTGLLERDFTEADDSESKMNKADKLSLLNRKVLEDQDIQNLPYEDIREILEYIEFHVVPYINDKNTAGQDLLNLFFTTFNKYVGKSDKNQAFTPDHICDFMSKVVGVNKSSRVLDPCCGSGAFLVRAMTDAMDDCDSDNERRQVREHQIYGIEYEDGAFGLSSTNMLIHGDGNSNVVKDSMFNRASWIQAKNIDVVLMNPPYNGTKNQCDPKYARTWSSNTKTDPSKGFHYVEWVARQISTAKNEDGSDRATHCRMAVLLPMQCAIGNSTAVKDFKKRMLEHYTLDAVFSLPPDVFYPGASVVACCMVFDLNRKHGKTDRSTFFGCYKNDGFVKRKGVGRVESTGPDGVSRWERIEREWLALYRERTSKPGMSVTRKVTWEDEWLAEAYMETDYGHLNEAGFRTAVNNHLAHLIRTGETYRDDELWRWMHDYIQHLHEDDSPDNQTLDVSDWRTYRIGDLFDIRPTGAYPDMGNDALDDNGTTPVIVNSSLNNGVGAYSTMPPLEEGNILTFSDTTDGNTFFYQKKPFIGFPHVQGMHPNGWELNPWVGLFLSHILTYRMQGLFNYGRKMRRDTVSDMVIKLPATADGAPDWEYMGDYIRRLAARP